MRAMIQPRPANISCFLALLLVKTKWEGGVSFVVFPTVMTIDPANDAAYPRIVSEWITAISGMN
jgi:hypothetical protein